MPAFTDPRKKVMVVVGLRSRTQSATSTVVADESEFGRMLERRRLATHSLQAPQARCSSAPRPSPCRAPSGGAGASTEPTAAVTSVDTAK